MDELFLYDQENGLFKQILAKSLVIEGRFHVSPNGGNDLNTADLESFLTTLNQPKYPAAILLTPYSRIVKMPSGSKMEEFTFQLYFLTTSGYTGDNQIKDLDPSRNTSKHPVWYDWKDMKQCAAEFMETLIKVIKSGVSGTGPTSVPLKTVIHIEESNAIYRRFTKMQTTGLSGASVTFIVHLDASICSSKDYQNIDIADITIPAIEIHPIHKH
jgi:hypothetical protein